MRTTEPGAGSARGQRLQQVFEPEIPIAAAEESTVRAPLTTFAQPMINWGGEWKPLTATPDGGFTWTAPASGTITSVSGVTAPVVKEGERIQPPDTAKAFLTEVNGRTLITAPANVFTTEAEKALHANEHFLWMQGRFVGAEKANRNGAFWKTDDLELGELTVRHGPLNWLHEARQMRRTTTHVGTVQRDLRPGEADLDRHRPGVDLPSRRRPGLELPARTVASRSQLRLYEEQVGTAAEANPSLRRVGLPGAAAEAGGRVLQEDRHELGAVDPEPGGEPSEFAICWGCFDPLVLADRDLLRPRRADGDRVDPGHLVGLHLGPASPLRPWGLLRLGVGHAAFGSESRSSSGGHVDQAHASSSL